MSGAEVVEGQRVEELKQMQGEARVGRWAIPMFFSKVIGFKHNNQTENSRAQTPQTEGKAPGNVCVAGGHTPPPAASSRSGHLWVRGKRKLNGSDSAICGEI